MTLYHIAHTYVAPGPNWRGFCWHSSRSSHWKFQIQYKEVLLIWITCLVHAQLTLLHYNLTNFFITFFLVILAPYGLQAKLTGVSYSRQHPMVRKVFEEWKHFYPLLSNDHCAMVSSYHGLVFYWVLFIRNWGGGNSLWLRLKWHSGMRIFRVLDIFVELLKEI